MRRHNISRSLNYKTKLLLKSVFNNTCSICGNVFDHTEIDHIKPLWDGGTDDIDNLQVVCYECHKKKSAEEHKEWSRQHPVFIYTYDDNGLVSIKEAKHGAR